MFASDSMHAFHFDKVIGPPGTRSRILSNQVTALCTLYSYGFVLTFMELDVIGFFISGKLLLAL